MLVAEILPSVQLSALDIALGVVALVAANLAIATWAGRGAHFALLLYDTYRPLRAARDQDDQQARPRTPVGCPCSS